MHPVIIGLVVFTFSLAGAFFGMWMRSILPGHHLDDDSKDTVKRGIGLIATMTALVLGLVTASAKSSFDAVDSTVKQAAVNIVAFDRVLARYGTETAEIRNTVKQVFEIRTELIWPSDSTKSVDLDPDHAGVGAMVEGLVVSIGNLKPQNESQEALRARALNFMEELLQSRWIAITRTDTSIPFPFLVILLFWLTVTFASFGLFAPRNSTVVCVLIVCALSVGSAVFLVLEMDSPFEGLITVSPKPMHSALEHLGR